MKTRIFTILLLMTTSLLAQESYRIYKPPTNFFEVGFCCSYICDLVFICLLVLAIMFFPLSIKALKGVGHSTSSKFLLPLAAISFLLGCVGSLASILTIPAFPPHLSPEVFGFQEKLEYLSDNLAYILYVSLFAVSISLFYTCLFTARIIKLSKHKEDNKWTQVI